MALRLDDIIFESICDGSYCEFSESASIGGTSTDNNYAIDSLPFYVSLFENYFLVDCKLLFDNFPTVGTISFNNSVTNTILANPSNSESFVKLGHYVYFDLHSLCSYNSISLPVSLLSLNGNGCEFKDTTLVNVFGRSIVYSVSRSYFGLVADNSYTALYDCSSQSGESITVPEALLTRYTAPVTTP